MTTHVAHLAVYPQKGEPGVDLPTVAVEPDGLTGDRRKKAAVHLVRLEDTDVEDPPRANIVLDTPEDLMELAGRTVTVGTVVLRITGPARNCPGVYAEVVTPGQVSVGDEARPD